MGFFRQEYWSGLPFLPPGNLPDPEIEPVSPGSPALQADFLPIKPSGKPILFNFFLNECIVVQRYEASAKCKLRIWRPLKGQTWTSLVAQWLRLALSMQGTWVQPLVRELDPTCHNWRPWVLQQRLEIPFVQKVRCGAAKFFFKGQVFFEDAKKYPRGFCFHTRWNKGDFIYSLTQKSPKKEKR